jgi:hypothetical protein
LDGSLRAAPFLDEEPDFSRADLPLYRVGVESWGGFVFLNLTPAEAPGGRAVAFILAGTGFATTVVSIGLALIPAADEPNRILAVTKVAGLTILLVAAGALVYYHGKRRQA